MDTMSTDQIPHIQFTCASQSLFSYDFRLLFWRIPLPVHCLRWTCRERIARDIFLPPRSTALLFQGLIAYQPSAIVKRTTRTGGAAEWVGYSIDGVSGHCDKSPTLTNICKSRQLCWTNSCRFINLFIWLDLGVTQSRYIRHEYSLPGPLLSLMSTPGGTASAQNGCYLAQISLKKARCQNVFSLAPMSIITECSPERWIASDERPKWLNS